MKWNQAQLRKIILIGLISILLLYLLFSLFKKPKPLEIPPPVVQVAHPQTQEVVEYVTQTGTTVAYQSVNLVARVEGYLEKISFKDGSFVKKGQELFIIQPEPYAEQLKAAQATVAAQKAIDAYNKSEYARQQRMYKQNATSLNEVEKWLARTQEMTAEIEKATANAVNASITYSYTHVLAPFAGRIGRHLVDLGNLVGKGEATTLATLEQIDPIYVYFNLNELDLIKLRAAARAKGINSENHPQVPVYVSLQNDPNKSYQATLDFVNTGLNAATGTMELRALLPNKDYLFLPGFFVQARIALSAPQKQLTIPNSAILYDQIGPYVYKVDDNEKVVLQRITLGGIAADRRAVTQGLKDTDRVIVDGIQNASVGNKVRIQKETTANEKKA
ncbi:MAG: efflux RND transporter periplasmic adaptor subunit [Legionella sp.]|nr:efflux RND transporter periplasmic adaptor subunit [Legionella sp.]